MGDLRRLTVFDLDGTLIDSRRDLADAANALIVERGGRPLPVNRIGRMVGEGAAVLVRRALSAAGLPVEASSVGRFLELYDERLLNTTRLYPGVPEALEALRPVSTIAVLTNKPLAPTCRLLDALGVSPFVTATIGGDGPFPRKPDPASLNHLITVLGASRTSTVVVGDSWIDYQTARAGGTRICLARYGFGFESVRLDELRGDEILANHPSDIPALLTRLRIDETVD